MPKITPLINSLNSGELSPHIDVRVDFNKYIKGCITLLGAIPLIEGGVIRTPGTYFCKETKDSSKKSRLFPFHFNTEQAYMLEFGDYYVRFYKDYGQIVIDTSMDDFNPASNYFVGEYTKVGDYKSLNAGGGSKYLYVAAPYGQVNSDTIKVGCESNTSDTLSVTAAGDTITIKLANITSSKNDAFLIQIALRALGTVNGVSVVNWTVTENAAYAAARPTAGVSIAAALMTSNEKIYQAIGKQSVSTYTGGNRILSFRIDPYLGTTYSISIESNTSDTLSVTLPSTTFIIKLANSTSTKNSAALIQAAMQALLGIFPVVTVGENSAYSDNRPTTGVSVPAQAMEVKHGGIFDYLELSIIFQPSTTNTAFFPIVETSYWTERTLGNPVEIGTPYNENEIFQIKRKPQSADTFYIFHVNHSPAKLVRHSHINWEYTTLSLKAGDGSRISISAATKANPCAITTSSNHGFSTGDEVYISGVLGMTELNNRLFTITYTAPTTFTLDDENSTYYTTYSSGGTVQKSKNIMATEGEYPSCGIFFEQRLLTAGYELYPQQIDGSVVTDYENFFQNPLEDDAAYQFTIKSDKVDRIRWLASDEYLLLGTADGVWKGEGGSLGEPITAGSIQVKKHIKVGSYDIDSEDVTDSILYLSRGATTVRQILWSLQNDKYMAPNLTRVASHITFGTTLATSGIKEMAFQREPFPILWAIRNDGQLLGMTYDIQEEVYAWFRIVTDGDFESVSVISTDNEEDQVWVIVKRTINGVTKRYIEYFTPINFYSIIADCFFVHSGLTTTLTDAIQITGLTHLALKEVDVMIAGSYLGRKTVSAGGVVTLGGTYSGKCHVGLPFDTIIEPMKLHVALNQGTVRGKKQRVNKITVCLNESCKGKVGRDATHLVEIDPNGSEGVLVTKDIDVEFPGDWHNEATLYLKQDKPYPFGIRGLVPEYTVNAD